MKMVQTNKSKVFNPTSKIILEKCVAVIDSCNSLLQIKIATNYVKLALKHIENENLYDELIKLIEIKEKVLCYEQIKERN